MINIEKTTFEAEGRIPVGQKTTYAEGVDKLIEQIGNKYGSFIANEITMRHIEEDEGCFFEFEVEGELLER